MQRPLTLVSLVAALLWADVGAVAAPLRVRARAVVTGHTLRSDTGLTLRGRLADDLDAPIAGALVHARIEGMEPRTVRTGSTGTFELKIASDDVSALAARHGDRLPWRLEFAGDPNFGSVLREGHLELRRTPTSTLLEVDKREMTLDDGPVTIDVTINGSGGPLANVPVHLRVARGPELVGDADERGRVAFLLRPSTVGAFGEVTIQARFAGDARFAPSQAVASLVVSRATRLTLRAGREGDTRSGRYRFSGRLTDERGALAGRTVGVVVSAGDDSASTERSQRSAVTDARGVFIVAVEAREFVGLAGESVEVQAVFQPSGMALEAARSDRALIPVPEPPGVPVSWYFACLAGAAGLVLFGVAFHLRFWLHLRQLWSRRRLRRHIAGAEADMVQPVVRTSTTERGRRDWIVGVAVDRDTGHAVDGVTVSLVGQEGAGFSAKTVEGRFALGPIPAGSWLLRLTGDGLMPREARLRLPHDGELDGMTVRIESVRGRVRDLFAGGVRRFAAHVRWGMHTPAEME
ncbi:MAG: Ig-like domain-containing protein, partial [Myxococcota bacterium]|nr:Ig-like domain-containing protein [Myxococcota bacterium]